MDIMLKSLLLACLLVSRISNMLSSVRAVETVWVGKRWCSDSQVETSGSLALDCQILITPINSEASLDLSLKTYSELTSLLEIIVSLNWSAKINSLICLVTANSYAPIAHTRHISLDHNTCSRLCTSLLSSKAHGLILGRSKNVDI